MSLKREIRNRAEMLHGVTYLIISGAGSLHSKFRIVNYAHQQTDRLCAEYYPPYGIGRLIYWLTRNRTCPICRIEGEQT